MSNEILQNELKSFDSKVNAYRQTTPSQSVRFDDSAGTVTYIGKAIMGADTSAAIWQIVKLDTTSGLVKMWADGDDLFDNIWDNRASLIYN